MAKIFLGMIMSLAAFSAFASEEAYIKIDQLICDNDAFLPPDIVPHPILPGWEPKPPKENESDLA
jgi:hypothetical protein